MGTDFFDRDFDREKAKAMNVTVGGGGALREMRGGRDSLSTADLSLTPLARRKQEVASQMASKASELNRLRAQQEALEAERRELEEQREKQEAYDRGREELKGRLEGMLAELRAGRQEHERLAAAAGEAVRQLEDRLGEVERLEEGAGTEEDAGAELDRGLAALGRIEGEVRELGGRLAGLRAASGRGAAEGGAAGSGRGRGVAWTGWGEDFGQWVRMGAAFALPFFAAGVLLLVLGWLIFW